MSQVVQLEIPEAVAVQARSFAEQAGKPIEAILIGWIGKSAAEAPVSALPDDVVLALCDSMMGEAEQSELSVLLETQQDSRLSSEGRVRLDQLIDKYRQGLLRKSEALREAVQRGLRPPLG